MSQLQPFYQFIVAVLVLLLIVHLYRMFFQSSKDSYADGSTCVKGYLSAFSPTDENKAAIGCCPSGKTKYWRMYDWCTGLENDTKCWTDDMCASGNCSGNFYGSRPGKCAPLPF